MISIPILNGLKANNRADLRLAMPLNLEPKLIDSGLSKGFLRSPPGLTLHGTGPGADRGAIVWNDVHYRVMGSKLVSVAANGMVTELGEVDDDDAPVSLDYSFDRLSIGSAGGLYYWDGAMLTQVTDVDLGTVVDHTWVDGFFMTTDGTSLVVTELNDPTSIDPLKYGSSEADPDGVVGLMRLPGEVAALNRHSIEFFRNIGGNGFPFQRILAAQIAKGCIGTFAKCRLGESFAFVGGGRNESLAVYIAGGGVSQQVSNPEVDLAINALSLAQQQAIELETRREEGEERLYVHLPSVTFVFLPGVSEGAGQPIWHELGAGPLGDQRYPVRHLARLGTDWFGGASDGRIGRLDKDVQSLFGEIAGGRFDTLLFYSQSAAGLLGQLELTGMPGRTPFGTDPKVFMSFTRDGETYSQERAVSMGGFGVRRERVVWRPNVRFGKYLGLRFRTANTALASWAALEGDIESLG